MAGSFFWDKTIYLILSSLPSSNFVVPLDLISSGLTHSNYKELNILYEKYKDQGSLLISVTYALSMVKLNLQDES